MDEIYHCILNYNDIYFCHFQIEISSNIFHSNFESVISLYFWSQCFEYVKEFHKFRFQISIHRTTLHFLSVVHQVSKNVSISIKNKISTKLIIYYYRKISIYHHIFNKLAQEAEVDFKKLSGHILVNLNMIVHPIDFQKY